MKQLRDVVSYACEGEHSRTGASPVKQRTAPCPAGPRDAFMSRQKHTRISSEVVTLLQNVQKLAVADWSLECGKYPESHLQDLEMRLDIAAHTAVLSWMFPEREPSKIPLEAYMWSGPVLKLLNEIGWLQGGVIVVDRHSPTKTTRLDADRKSVV